MTAAEAGVWSRIPLLNALLKLFRLITGTPGRGGWDCKEGLEVTAGPCGRNCLTFVVTGREQVVLRQGFSVALFAPGWVLETQVNESGKTVLLG